MNQKLRLSCVSVATAALAAAATLAASPAQAGDQHFTFTKHTTKRSVTTTRTLAGTRTASAAYTTPIYRLAGNDRIQTAIAASQDAWADAGSTTGGVAKAVVLTRYDEYADALGGSALAGAAEGPLLMTPPTSLNSAVKAEIDRVLGGKGTVYILGGTDVMSAGTEAALTQAGYAVVRLAGPDRFDTSVKIAEEVGKLSPTGAPQFVFATTGMNFPDGLAAGATAGGVWASVVLTNGSTVTPSVKAYLDTMTAASVDEYAVGGDATAATRTWQAAFNGADRYETAALVAEGFWADPAPADDPVAIGLATGMNWPDALAGGAYMAGLGPLVLTRATSLPTPTADATKAIVASGTPSPVQFGAVFGGTDVVGTTPVDQLGALLG